MIKRLFLLWLVVLFTLVPYGIYYLFFEATRDQYALVGVLVLFWIFGFWGVVGPIVSAYKARSFFKALENAGSAEELKSLIRDPESREVAIDLIASENNVPKFVASRIYNLLVKRFSEIESLGDTH